MTKKTLKSIKLCCGLHQTRLLSGQETLWFLCPEHIILKGLVFVCSWVLEAPLFSLDLKGFFPEIPWKSNVCSAFLIVDVSSLAASESPTKDVKTFSRSWWFLFASVYLVTGRTLWNKVRAASDVLEDYFFQWIYFTILGEPFRVPKIAKWSTV